MALKLKSYDEAKELLTSTKEELQIAKDERKAFAKEHSLSLKEDHSEDPKHGKKWKKLVAPIETKTAQIEEIKAYMAENKPKKAASERAVKYTYPADMTDANEKKKYRAAERRKAASAAKGETADGETTPKSKKKKSKEEPAPSEVAETSTKSSKKDKSAKSGKKDKSGKKNTEAPAED